MTPNPTSAPAPQEAIRDLVRDFAQLHTSACNSSEEAISAGLMLLVKNAIKLDRLTLADEAEREPVNIWKSLPRCCGYPRCDGDLVGTSHEPGCPLFGKPEPTPAQRVAAWLREKAQ